MKAMISLSLMFFASLALANGPIDQDRPRGSKINYLSWCEGDQIMMEDEDGQVYVRWDCFENGDSMRCTEFTSKEGQWTVVRATCN